MKSEKAMEDLRIIRDTLARTSAGRSWSRWGGGCNVGQGIFYWRHGDPFSLCCWGGFLPVAGDCFHLARARISGGWGPGFEPRERMPQRRTSGVPAAGESASGRVCCHAHDGDHLRLHIQSHRTLRIHLRHHHVDLWRCDGAGGIVCKPRLACSGSLVLHLRSVGRGTSLRLEFPRYCSAWGCRFRWVGFVGFHAAGGMSHDREPPGATNPASPRRSAAPADTT